MDCQCNSQSGKSECSHSWTRPEAVAPISSILTRTGWFIDRRESCETDSVTVALNSSVWRERGAAWMISSSSARNPYARRGVSESMPNSGHGGAPPRAFGQPRRAQGPPLRPC